MGTEGYASRSSNSLERLGDCGKASKASLEIRLISTVTIYPGLFTKGMQVGHACAKEFPQRSRIQISTAIWG